MVATLVWRDEVLSRGFNIEPPRDQTCEPRERNNNTLRRSTRDDIVDVGDRFESGATTVAVSTSIYSMLHKQAWQQCRYSFCPVREG